VTLTAVLVLAALTVLPLAAGLLFRHVTRSHP
jgi:hypothetical protein